MYKIPDEHFLRLHFERSRFSRRLEDMLLILSNRITNLGILEKGKFDRLLDEIIRRTVSVPLAEKTIKNQRTEMIRLFGLVKYVDGLAVPGNRLSFLAQTQDIPRFFKSFCKQFQFPGGFLKPDKVSAMVREGVKFKPARYILQLMKIAESKYGEFGINAAEVTHFVFNDKRVTVENKHPKFTLERIVKNRKQENKLDNTSDVIRYARDFLRYMVEANLLWEYKGIYTLNNRETKAIMSIIKYEDFFDGYSGVINDDGTWDLEEYKKVDEKWSEWFSDGEEDKDLETPTTALVKDDSHFPEQWKKIKEILERKDSRMKGVATKEIGDEGEKIVYEYELESVSKVRKDLKHMVRIVSNTTWLGYDILSVHAEKGRRKKYIEVKTTKKNYEPKVEIPFTMSMNEWSVAEQHKDDYFIYRVTITKEGISIFSIQNPTLCKKKGKLIAEPVAFKIVYSKESGKYLGL
jgi:hypothetical protein